MIRRHCWLPSSAGVSGLRPGAPAVLMFLLIAAPALTIAGTHVVQRARNATADVVRDGGDWVVSVEFLASHSLGRTKDIEVNRRLAGDYALRGLFRELGGKPEDDLVVSGFQTESSEEEDGIWKARFRTPANGVSIRPKPTPEPAAEAPENIQNDAAAPIPAGVDVHGAIVATASAGASDLDGASTSTEVDSAAASVSPASAVPVPTVPVPDVKSPALPVPVPDVKSPALPVPVPDIKASVLPVPTLQVPNISNPAP